jgi:hypothetical protein
MDDKELYPFSGTVVRTEPGGFGIIHFDKPLGPGAANAYGIMSSSSGTSTSTYISLDRLKPGVRVVGKAEADTQHDWATITIITSILPSV